MKKILSLTAALVLAAGALFAGEPTHWLNVHVNSTEDHAKVEVRLPMNLVLTVLDAVKTDQIRAGKIRLDLPNAQLDWPKLLKAIQDAPDAQFVTVKSDDADVVVSKKAGTVLIQVQEKTDDQAHVEVQVPANLLNALTVDDENRLDLKALIASLQATSIGDIVRVTAPDADVRVWVD